MDAFLKDLRYGLRMLRTHPGFTLIAVFTLSLGLGANTAIFSLVDKILIRPLPVEEPQRLVSLGRYFKQNGVTDHFFSYPAFAEYRERNEVLDELACYATSSVSLSDNGQSELIQGMIVSGNYFKALRLTPALGRGFLPEEDQTPGTHLVAVLSYGLWQRRFGADPKVIGQTINLNNHTFAVVGVTPPEFTGTYRGYAPDIYLPMMMLGQAIPARGSGGLTDIENKWLLVFGRLKNGVSREQAAAAMDVLGRAREQAESEIYIQRYNLKPNNNANVVWPQYILRDGSQGYASLIENLIFPLKMLMGVVGLVLLIACANVANLLLARATGRQKEIAVRLAVGASRGRLVRQLMTESMLLSMLGGVAGLLLAFYTSKLLEVFTPPNIEVSLSLAGNLDGRVLGYTLGVSLVTGLLFGLTPALSASRPDLVTALKNESAASRGFSWLGLKNLLVVVQVALSLIVLVGAGLCIRSLQKQQAIDAGFEPSKVLLATMNLSLTGYDQTRGQDFYQRLTERLESLPGVESASLAMVTMLSGQPFNWTARVAGYKPAPGEDMNFRYNVVTPKYFQTLGIPLLRGRDFTVQDTAAGAPVMIVNETVAKRYWPNGDAIGKQISLGNRSLEIIGIAKDSKYANLTEETKRTMYLPLGQNYRPTLTLHLRTAVDPQPMIGAVRREIQAMDAQLSLYNIKTFEEQKNRSLYTAHLAARLLSVFGLLALLLAAVGLYGVMSYVVTQHTREIGIRMALGAQSRDVLKLVVGQGLVITLIGVAVGLAAAFAFTRLASNLLYGVTPTDPLTYGLVAALLTLVALLACYLPARRATKVDPMVALRYE